MIQYAKVIWAFNLLNYIINYKFPLINLEILLLWPILYILSHLILLKMHRILQYLVICLPLIIAAYVPRTITEGVFSTSLVVVLSIKMYVCSLNSLTLLQFTRYMWSPVLCYKNYQYNSSRNYKKIILHFISILLICLWNSYFIQYELSRIYINPQFISFTIEYTYYISIFVIVNFQLIFIDGFGLFAEITCIQERDFYQDWWNTTNYIDFNRKWNRQVHLFLKTYVLSQLRHKYGKKRGLLLLFLISAILHEYCLAVIFRVIRPIFTLMYLFQFPLTRITNNGFILFAQIVYGISFMTYFYKL